MPILFGLMRAPRFSISHRLLYFSYNFCYLIYVVVRLPYAFPIYFFLKVTAKVSWIMNEHLSRVWLRSKGAVLTDGFVQKVFTSERYLYCLTFFYRGSHITVFSARIRLFNQTFGIMLYLKGFQKLELTFIMNILKNTFCRGPKLTTAQDHFALGMGLLHKTRPIHALKPQPCHYTPPFRNGASVLLQTTRLTELLVPFKRILNGLHALS